MDGFMTSLVAHRSAIFEHFKEMIPALSKALPEFTILVRPHPVENQVPWDKIAGACGNVQVVNEGNVIPWLMACEALVHNGCTTAVEAFVLGTQAVAYQPVRMEDFDDELPNSLSHRAFSTDDLAQMLRSIVAGKLGSDDYPDRRRRIDRHIAALDGPLAAERMVDVLEQAGYAKPIAPEVESEPVSPRLGPHEGSAPA